MAQNVRARSRPCPEHSRSSESQTADKRLTRDTRQERDAGCGRVPARAPRASIRRAGRAALRRDRAAVGATRQPRARRTTPPTMQTSSQHKFNSDECRNLRQLALDQRASSKTWSKGQGVKRSTQKRGRVTLQRIAKDTSGQMVFWGKLFNGSWGDGLDLLDPIIFGWSKYKVTNEHPEFRSRFLMFFRGF